MIIPNVETVPNFWLSCPSFLPNSDTTLLMLRTIIACAIPDTNKTLIIQWQHNSYSLFLYFSLYWSLDFRMKLWWLFFFSVFFNLQLSSYLGLTSFTLMVHSLYINWEAFTLLMFYVWIVPPSLFKFLTFCICHLVCLLSALVH